MDLETADTSRVVRPERWRSRNAILRLVGTSFVFCIASITTTSANKMALVSLNCSSLMIGLGQLVATTLTLAAIKSVSSAEFPVVTFAELKRTFPLSVVYVLSLFLSIESTRAVAYPAYVLLQWTMLPLVAVGQILLFSRHESLQVNAALAMMETGVLLAGVHYCSASEFAGYSMVVLSNAVYVTYILYTAKALGDHVSSAIKVLYCNAVVGLGLTLLLAAATGELRATYEYPHWTSRSFALLFSLACVCGAITTLTTVGILRITSTMTFTVVDGIKNLAVTYVGIYMASEFRFELPLWRFYGTHVTLAGCLFYIYYRVYYGKPQRTGLVRAKVIHL